MSRRRARPLPRLGGNGPAARGLRDDLGDVNRGWKSGEGTKVVLVCGGRPGENCGRVVATAHFRLTDLPDGSRGVVLVSFESATFSADERTATPWRGLACGDGLPAGGCGVTYRPVSIAVLERIAGTLMEAGATRRDFLWQNVAAVQ